MSMRILIGSVIVLTLTACGSSPAAPSLQVPYSSEDLRLGDGATAIDGSFIQVNYTGWLYDPSAPEHKGRQFDTTAGKSPANFYLLQAQVIKGWLLGVPGMKVGGLRRLVLPPDLGYGANPQNNGAIPANSTLIFEIELLAVQ